MRTKATDPIGYVRAHVEDAFWQVGYHEMELVKARRQLALAQELIERGSFNIDVEPAEDRNDLDDRNFENVDQYAQAILDDAEGSVRHHEEELRAAHNDLALAKIMLGRGNYTEINLDDVQKATAERLKR